MGTSSGLDPGTSVVKAAIFDLQGNELSRGARSVPITNPEPHLAEEDMQEVGRRDRGDQPRARSAAPSRPRRSWA